MSKLNFLLLAHHEKLAKTDLIERFLRFASKREGAFYVPLDDPLAEAWPDRAIDPTRGDVDISLLVTFGGDGTILRAVNLAACLDVPIMGINLGKLGFLAGVMPEEMEIALSRFVEGNYLLNERMLLECRVGNEPDPRYALNDCVVVKTAAEKILRFSLEISGEDLQSFTADGVIFSTPTGSTAYSLSAGGPIVSPEVRAMVVTLICPHSLFSRSLILSTYETAVARLSPESKEANAVVDGRTWQTLRSGEGVEVRCSEKSLKLVSLRDEGFFKIFKRHFFLGDVGSTTDAS